MIYTANAFVVKEPLNVLAYEWSDIGSKLLIIFSNNPLNVTTTEMPMYRRLLSGKGSILLEDTTISVAIA